MLVQVAASLWSSGTVDLGDIACALGDRSFQAVLDALAGQRVTSDADSAVRRAATTRLPAPDQSRDVRDGYRFQTPALPPAARPGHARER